MARPLYSHELGDPDFSWLISSFLESHPGYTVCENPLLPVVLIETPTGSMPISAPPKSESDEFADDVDRK